MIRRLLVTVRQSDATTAPAIDIAWRRLRDAVHAAGGRAWRFRSPSEPGRLLEFVEWQEGPEKPGVPSLGGVSGALEALDRIATFTSRETWEEAP